jgi:hypothetical protein
MTPDWPAALTDQHRRIAQQQGVIPFSGPDHQAVSEAEARWQEQNPDAVIVRALALKTADGRRKIEVQWRLER